LLRRSIFNWHQAVFASKIVLVIALGAIALPAFAHHSFGADYDASKPFTLTGRVTKIEWMNPHVHFYMDVKDESGKVNNWAFELGSPNALMRAGLTRHSLQVGEEITVKGSLSKDFACRGNATTLLSSDGKVLLSGRASGRDLVAR
jgi:Family of unknown function (DUF6152)